MWLVIYIYNLLLENITNWILHNKRHATDNSVTLNTKNVFIVDDYFINDFFNEKSVYILVSPS